MPLVPSTDEKDEKGSLEEIFSNFIMGTTREYGESTSGMIAEGQNLTVSISGENNASYWRGRVRQLEGQLEDARLEIDKWHEEANYIALELEHLESQYNRVLEAHRPNLDSVHRLSKADLPSSFTSLSHNISAFSDDACHTLDVDEVQTDRLLYHLHGSHNRPSRKLLEVKTHANHVLVAIIFKWLLEGVFPSERPSDYWAPTEKSQLTFEVEKMLAAGKIHVFVMRYLC